jgi:hypothetical protein
MMAVPPDTIAPNLNTNMVGDKQLRVTPQTYITGLSGYRNSVNGYYEKTPLRGDEPCP